jgi:hypothetical protein
MNVLNRVAKFAYDKLYGENLEENRKVKAEIEKIKNSSCSCAKTKYLYRIIEHDLKGDGYYSPCHYYTLDYRETSSDTWIKLLGTIFNTLEEARRYVKNANSENGGIPFTHTVIEEIS